MAGTHDEGEIFIEDHPVGWIRESPLKPRALVILAHGAGASSSHPFMEATASGLLERRFAVIRFNFPYMEQMARGGKRRPPNTPRILLLTWEAMIEQAIADGGDLPLILSGKSMGGRMASMLLADGRAPQAKAVVYLGYPLHAPGKSDKLRADHLSDVPVPQLFIQGTRDNLCKLDKLHSVLDGLGKKARLHVVEGGDHSLAPSRKDPLGGIDVWLDAMAGFIEETAL